QPRVRGDGHARLGSLVQPSPTAGADREHPASGSRSGLLSATGRAARSGVTQTKQPPGKPGRFRALTTSSPWELKSNVSSWSDSSRFVAAFADLRRSVCDPAGSSFAMRRCANQLLQLPDRATPDAEPVRYAAVGIAVSLWHAGEDRAFLSG